jgi:hypothetical protein
LSEDKNNIRLEVNEKLKAARWKKEIQLKENFTSEPGIKLLKEW